MLHLPTLPPNIKTRDDVYTLNRAADHFHTYFSSGIISWRKWGVGRPLVLLHGGSGSWTHWVRNIVDLVLQGRSVWVPDLPGFGESTKPEGGDDADVVADSLESGFFELFGNSSVDIVGFSFGALVGGFIATKTPHRVSKLVLIGAPALSSSPPPKIDLQQWEHLKSKSERADVHRHNLAALMLSQESSIDELAISLHAENVERDRMKRRRLIFSDALLKQLPQIQSPVAGIWGADDVIYRDRIEVIGNALAHAPCLDQFCLIAKAGHWVQYEQPMAFNRILGRMLKS